MKNECSLKTEQNEASTSMNDELDIKLSMESLILAQDERWRRA
jgi:hypothetical protein